MLRWLRRPPADFQTESRIAEVALIRGDFAEASARYKRMAKLWPHIAFVHTRRGRALLQLGRQAEAAREFDQALSIDPNEPEALFYKGISAEALGKDEVASQFYERAFAVDPPHPEAGMKLAAAHFARGSLPAALELYRRVLDLNPDIAEAQFGYGEAAILAGHEADAIQAFQQAIAINRNFHSAQATAILSQLFHTPSARRPRARRPLICIPMISTYYRDWLGGQSYLINFARIMSTLPLAERPRILVVAAFENTTDGENWQFLSDEFLRSQAVIAIVDAQATILHAKPALCRAIRRNNRNGTRANRFVERLITTIDWTFPVLYPLWRVPAIPGPLFWIPDLQHRFWPSFFSMEEVRGRDRDMKATALRAVPIVFSSQTARQHFNEQIPARGCRTYVWHFVSQPDIKLSPQKDWFASLNLPERYYYTPNQFWRHKDHGTLLHALRRLLNLGHKVTFVCTGTDLETAKDDYSRELLALIKNLSLEGHLRLLGVLPRPEQIEVMRHCCAVIQPSLFEGWSTVIEDARAIGRPIIVSDIPVHREQIAGGASFFTPGDPEALAAAVIDVDPLLKPGPDPEREATAATELRNRMHHSAREFLAILGQEAKFRT